MSTGTLTREPEAVVYDGQLAFLGAAPKGDPPMPGGLVEFEVYWMPVASVQRAYVVVYDMLDANGIRVHRHIRHLGYGFWPAEWWPLRTAMSETYRLIVPRTVPPGNYQLVMGLAWVQGKEYGAAETDHPTVRAHSECFRSSRADDECL
jgi:hypothetical protein